MRGPLSFLQSCQLNALQQPLLPIISSHIADVPVWKLTSSGVLSMKSFYRFLSFSCLRCPFSNVIWKLHALEKVKVFLWLATKNRLYTYNILSKKGWNLSLGCAFCDYSSKTAKYLIFCCSFAKSL